jgi:hypothetical protein
MLNIMLTVKLVLTFLKNNIKYFKEARDKANITWPKDCTALPPFHEQRSLSSRTYKAQGIDVKTL